MAAEGFMEALASIFGERQRLSIAENLNGLARCVHHQAAFATAVEVMLDFGAKGGIQIRVQKVIQLGNQLPALHACSLR
jgi:hypothetical protein